MKYRRLGKSGPTVSQLGLGCMGMSPCYGLTDDKVSIQVIEKAYERGITFFDTADMYGRGGNEELVGKAIKSFRDKIILATKCAIKYVGEDIEIDNRPEYIKEACDGSLKRLGVDVIDLYYLHRYNPEIPLEDSMGALLDLIDEGKVRYIGLSEVNSQILERAHQILGDKLVALQSEYSIANAKAAETVIPMCRKLGVSLVPYSPLGRGLLSNNCPDTSVSDFRIRLPQFQPEVISHNLELAKALNEIAKEKQCTVAQLALAWLFSQGDDMIPIPGTKRLEYLEDNLGSIDLPFTKSDFMRIEEVREKHPFMGLRYPEFLMKLFHLEV